MKHWNWNLSLLISGLVSILCLARIGVSIGRLVYSIHTGSPFAGSNTLPPWYTLVLEDGFFYVGIAALILAVVSAIQTRKSK